MPYLGLKIFLWKLTIGQFSTDENVVIQNNETIEICMNDEIMKKMTMCKPKQARIQKMKEKNKWR